MSGVGFKISTHREGRRFVIIALIISALLFYISKYIGFISLILPFFVMYFFRNPQRVIPVGDHIIVSPADGVVSCIRYEEPSKALNIGEEKRYCVSIFLSVFNVHINRIPATGTIKNVIYTPGKFFNATFDKSSVFNERNTIVMDTKYNGSSIAFTQIAGLIARRIVCYGYSGQEVEAGNIFGLIRFGSRCDIWLPVGSKPLVLEGQTMVGGETIICNMMNDDCLGIVGSKVL